MSYIIEKIPTSNVHLNPQNPRKITDEQFKKLKESITRFPKMLELRPLIIGANNEVIGGNMRLLAMQKLGFTEVYIVRASDLTPDEIRQFVVLDNLSFGFWDYDMLGAQYEMPELTSWGFPAFDLGMDDEEEPDTLTAGKSDKKPTIKVSFENVTDLESIKPLIEEAIKPYVDIGTKITISVSAGEL